MADTTPSANPSFQNLAARYGISTAIALLPLLDRGATPTRKAFAGASLAGTGTKAIGAATGSPAISSIGKGFGTALGLAGTGHGVYQTATDPNLSTTQKAGHANQLAGEAALSIGVPYAGLAILAKHLIGAMEGSKSPQVSGIGKGLAYPARPVEGLLSVLSGDLSPKAAGNRMVSQARNTPGLKSLINPVFDFFGLGTKPSQGTQFRNQIQSLFNQIPALKGTNTSNYNMAGGVNAYNAYSPQARASAEAIARTLGPLSPTFKKQDAAGQASYIGQIANILLNQHGNSVPSI